MPIIQPDLSDTQGNLEGTYRSTINEVTPGTSGTGNPKLVVKLGVQVKDKTITRTAHVPTSGKGAFQFEGLLRAAGFGDYANELRRAVKEGTEAPTFDTDELLGCELDVKFITDPNDASRDTIDRYLKV